MTVSPPETGNVELNGAVYTGSCGYSTGTELNIEAIAEVSYRFDHWGEALSGNTNPVTLKMDSDKYVIAYFVLKTESVGPNEAKSLIDGSKDIFIIDVSGESEYEYSHLLCAKNYVWKSNTNNFSTSISNLSPYKKNDILLYDHSGNQSYNAAEYLADQGFESTYYMTDSLDDWIAEGYETFTTAEDEGKCTSLRPMAYAGFDQNVNENANVTLRGQGSGPNGGTVTYSWSQVQGANTVQLLPSTTTAQPTFKAPDLNGTDDELIFRLTVTDNGGLTDTDTVQIVVQANDPPEANAGSDQTVTQGQAVILDSSGSTDADGSIASRAWTQTGGTPAVTLSNPAAIKPTFTAPDVSASTVLTFKLTVTDNEGATETDTVTVTVNPPAENQGPTANAGADQSVKEGKIGTLDGTGSTDSDGTIASYTWSQTDSTGVTVALSNSSAAKPTFTAPDVDASTILTFMLVVTDNEGAASSADTVRITITKSSGGGGGGGCFINSLAN